MARPANVFHVEVSTKRRHLQRLLIPEREPSWKGRSGRHQVPSSVAKLFPSNADLAAAVGLGKPEEHKRGSAAYRKRASFMGQARRWRSEKRNPDVGKLWGPRLRSAGRKAQRKLATPLTERDVLDLMVRYGVTVDHVDGFIEYQDRQRDVAKTVYVEPGLLAHHFDGESFAELAGEGRLRWGPLAEAFLTAWSFAYAGDEHLFGGDQFESMDLLVFSIGWDRGANYAYGLGEVA